MQSMVVGKGDTRRSVGSGSFRRGRLLSLDSARLAGLCAQADSAQWRRTMPAGAFVDRTDEFLLCTKQFQSARSGDDSTTVAERAPQQKPSASEFAKAAGLVSRRVEVTASKLGQLTRMVKSSSMFNDSGNDINRLSQSIKEEMTGLKHDIDTLSQRIGMSSGGQSAQHSKQLVRSLQMQLGRQSKNFQNVLQDRAKTLKDQQDRRFRMGVASSPGSALGRPMVFGSAGSGGQGPGASSAVSLGPGSSLHSAPPTSLGGGLRARNTDSPLRLQETQLVSNYAESRAQAVDTINTTMGELSTAFSQLMEMIEYQGTEIQRIDDNVEDIEMNMAGGLNQLQQTYNNHSNIMLLAKIFGVSVTFMIMFIVFFA